MDPTTPGHERDIGSPTDAGERPDGDERAVDTVVEYRGTGVMWSAVAALAVIVLLVVVTLQNTQDVELNVLWADLSVPLALLLLIVVGVTVVVTEIVGLMWRRRRRTVRRDRDELRRLRRRDAD